MKKEKKEKNIKFSINKACHRPRHVKSSLFTAGHHSGRFAIKGWVGSTVGNYAPGCPDPKHSLRTTALPTPERTKMMAKSPPKPPKTAKIY